MNPLAYAATTALARIAPAYAAGSYINKWASKISDAAYDAMAQRRMEQGESPGVGEAAIATAINLVPNALLGGGVPANAERVGLNAVSRVANQNIPKVFRRNLNVSAPSPGMVSGAYGAGVNGPDVVNAMGSVRPPLEVREQ
jgi:hypothetical protein